MNYMRLPHGPIHGRRTIDALRILRSYASCTRAQRSVERTFARCGSSIRDDGAVRVEAPRTHDPLSTKQSPGQATSALEVAATAPDSRPRGQADGLPRRRTGGPRAVATRTIGRGTASAHWDESGDRIGGVPARLPCSLSCSARNAIRSSSGSGAGGWEIFSRG